MKALITGATGFVGQNLARYLMGEGWTVGVVIRESSDRSRVPDACRPFTYDGSLPSLTDACQQLKPDVVFHLAALFIAEHKPEDVGRLVDSNVRFGAHLLEAMTAAGVSRLVNTGTSWQHYQDHDYSPSCLYAATKQAFEAILQFYVETTPLRAITLVLYDTYGANDPRPKLFSTLRRIGREGTALDMSKGEQLVDLVHIDDVVRAYGIAAARLETMERGEHARYAVSSSKPLPLRELVAVYERVIGKPLPIRWGARPYRKREIMVPWTSGAPLPGWTPAVGLEEGLRRMESESR